MKDKNYFSILNAVLRWKMADLSRLSGVNRPLIHYAVFAVFFGLVLVPDLSEATLDRVLKAMRLPL